MNKNYYSYHLINNDLYSNILSMVCLMYRQFLHKLSKSITLLSSAGAQLHLPYITTEKLEVGGNAGSDVRKTRKCRSVSTP